MFTVPFEDADPPYEAIWEAMVGSDGKVKVVRPNAATVLKPASEQNYLYELDKTTSEVVSAITTWRFLELNKRSNCLLLRQPFRSFRD